MDWRQFTCRWLSRNFCYRQQATSPVCWHRDTVHAKDDDNTGDEEVCGRRPTHLEQSASCPSNRTRPTCLTGTDSVSEDYLGCALQICISSTSSSLCGLFNGHCHSYEHPPCLSIPCSITGSCRTNVEVRVNCLEPGVLRSAWYAVPVPRQSGHIGPEGLT